MPVPEVQRIFPPEQRRLWPAGYVPTAAAGYFMRPEGVALRELIDAREDMRHDKRHDLQRDLAHDYQLWCRSAFEHWGRSLSQHDHGTFKRVASRATLPDYADVVGSFDLPSLANENIEAVCDVLPGVEETTRTKEKILHRRMHSEARRDRLMEERMRKLRGGDTQPPPPPPPANSMWKGAEPYPFTSYAYTQQIVLQPIQQCRSTLDNIRFTEFPTLRNLLHMHHDSASHLQFLAHKTGDELFLNQQLVEAVAVYLRGRWEALANDEERKKPIITLFGNGRLADALNRSGVLPVNVYGCTPANVARQLKRGGGKQAALPESVRTPRTFGATFPYEVIDVDKALAKYRPSLVLMEPHMDRDFTGEARGYHTVREVLMLGRVDSPGMASFTYPWLSFGCAPSADTYWLVNEKLQVQEVPDDKSFMPTEPPFAMQGYEKLYVDSISRWLVGANDTPRLPHQYRCVAFRRTEIPDARKPEPAEPVASSE